MKLLNYFKIKSPFKLCIHRYYFFCFVLVTFYQYETRQVPEQEGEGGGSSAFWWWPELVLALKQELRGCFWGLFFSFSSLPGAGAALSCSWGEQERWVFTGWSQGWRKLGAKRRGDLGVPTRVSKFEHPHGIHVLGSGFWEQSLSGGGGVIRKV